MKITRAEPGGFGGQGPLAAGRAGHPAARTNRRRMNDSTLPAQFLTPATPNLPRRRKAKPWPASYNWQIGREMSYWYPESRPKRQFAAVFDINKCIACQTCTLACKTTWTSGKGQEYMLWNNVESKPYGCYPLAWDLKLLEACSGRRSGAAAQYDGPTIFEAAPAGERVLGWRPEDLDFAYPNVGEDDCAGPDRPRRGPATAAPQLVLLPGADLQPLHLSRPASPRARGARSTSGPRTASCCWTRAAAAATANAPRAARTRRSSTTRLPARRRSASPATRSSRRACSSSAS